MARGLESPTGIEPARIEAAGDELVDLIADISARAEGLGKALHPRTASNLASVARMINTYYSNLIKGHNTRPRDIERAQAGTRDEDKRDLMAETAAHYRMQEGIDAAYQVGSLPDPANPDFIRQLHRDFYAEASVEMLTMTSPDRKFVMVPGEWRSEPRHDVIVGVQIAILGACDQLHGLFTNASRSSPAMA